MPKVSKKAVVESSSSESESQSEIESETESEREPEPEPVKKNKSKQKVDSESEEPTKQSKKSKDWVDLDIDMPKQKQTVVVSAVKTKTSEQKEPKELKELKASSFDYTKYRDLDLSIEDLVKYCIVKSHDSRQFHLGKIFKQILRGMNFEDVLPEVKANGSRHTYEAPRHPYEVRGRGGQSYRGRGGRGGVRGNPRTFQYDE